jgi:serine O-acetyltransferase
MLVGKNLREDYIQKFRHTQVDSKVSLRGVLLLAMADRGFRAVFLYRIGRWFRIRKRRIPAALTERVIRRLCFCEISTTADIGPGFSIYHPFGMVVGTHSKAGKNFTISMDVVLGGNHDKKRADGTEKPIIGDNVNIASGSKVVGPVMIGDNVIIGANSVVISDIPSNSVAAGSPARIVRLNGQKISLLADKGELSAILQNLIGRIEVLEKRLP